MTTHEITDAVEDIKAAKQDMAIRLSALDVKWKDLAMRVRRGEITRDEFEASRKAILAEYEAIECDLFFGGSDAVTTHTAPSPGAIRAAARIWGLDWEHGKNPIEGIAALIEAETGAAELAEALESALWEVEGFQKRTGIPQFAGWISTARAALDRYKKGA